MLMFSPVQVNSLQLPKCWNQQDERQNQVSSQHSHLGLMSKRLAHGWWNSEEEPDIILYYYKKCDAVPLFTYRQNTLLCFTVLSEKFNVRLLATNTWPRGCTLSMYAMSQFTNSSTLALIVALYTCSTALGSEFFHALHVSWHRGSATGQRVGPRSWQGVGWRTW